MTRAEELAAALRALEARLAAACAFAGRSRADVTLVAVSKTRPARDVEVLRDLGVLHFGENRDQEARRKAAEVPGVHWHFVGTVQTNKARSVASYASVVHSADRPVLVAALSAAAVRTGRTLDLLIQVSLDADPSRGGTLPADLPALADQVAAAAGLRLQGVMAVAPRAGDPAQAFARLQALAGRLREDHPRACAISAGMTNDLEAAIGAGSTHVRVGTALFGRRPPALRYSPGDITVT